MKFVNYANKVITKHCHFAKMIDADVPQHSLKAVVALTLLEVSM